MHQDIEIETDIENINLKKIIYPHRPPHKFPAKGSYMITCGTQRKEHLFNTAEKRTLHQNNIINISKKYNWSLTAWAVFSNHYHMIIHTEDDAKTLPRFIVTLHNVSSLQLNKLDNLLGREVWYQYWDTFLTFKNSYYARLNYVINNPVKHKIVPDAKEYPWCSASWFYNNADKEYRKMVEGFKCDKIYVKDDF